MKLTAFIKDMWADTEVSETEMNDYYELKTKWRAAGKNTSDMLEPISGREMIIIAGSVIIFFSIVLCLILVHS